MKRFYAQIISLICLSATAQEIKTKVQESGFEIKPDAEKVVEFEPARTFIYAGIGWSRRLGDITTGFTALPSATNPIQTKYITTKDPDPHQNGVVFSLGLRHFFPKNYGLGIRFGLFYNNAEFLDINSGFVGSKDKADVTTLIGSGLIEGLYRIPFFSDKDGAVYGGLGLGTTYINQNQQYRYNRTTNISQAFFAARPAIGVSYPVWDIFNINTEVAYLYSEGTIPDGSLSLSQFQWLAGIHIRLNSF